MCGIAGYIGPRIISTKREHDCLARMHRRGPDAAGVFRHTHADRHVCLLHSRLSIIDLDRRSHQPFRLDGQALVFNGELYNFKELRQELNRQGQAFTTTGDTEVLGRLLSTHGPDSLAGCEGMWSFGFYTESDGSLLLSRDRFGEKPLYLYRDADNGLYFGSEVKFLMALCGHRFQVNLEHLYRYMVNGYKALYKTRDTFHQGVTELQPGHCLRIDHSGREKLSPYWQPTESVIEKDMTRKEAVAGIRKRLIQSVRLRLRADVPLAFCMSGGIDSNCLISIAKKMFGYDVHGFTVMNADERYEEKEHVDHMVAELKLRHTPVNISNQAFRQNLTSLIRQHDAPVYTISYYVHWLMMEKMQQKGYRISVSGTGADELFTGYFDHHNLFLYEMLTDPEFDAALKGWQEKIAPVVRNPHLQNPLLYLKNEDFREHVFLNNAIFSGYLKSEWMEEFTEISYMESLLRNRMLNELFHEAVPVILHEDDLNAMYYSIENRSPFLDRDLYEFAYSIPTRLLIRDGYAKVLLREAMAGIVPEKILWNPRKVGFNAPIMSLLDIENPETRQFLLGDSPLWDYVHRGKVRQLVDQPFLKNSESKFLFYLLNSKIFLEEYL